MSDIVYDALVRHRILLQRLAVGDAQQLQVIFKKAIKPLIYKLKNSPQISASEFQALLKGLQTNLSEELFSNAIKNLKEFVPYEVGVNMRILSKKFAITPPKNILPKVLKSQINVGVGVRASINQVYKSLEKNVVNDIKYALLAEGFEARRKSTRKAMLKAINAKINSTINTRLLTVSKTVVNHTTTFIGSAIADASKLSFVEWDHLLEGDGICEDCAVYYGGVWPNGEQPEEPPLHTNCLCFLTWRDTP